MNIMLWDGWFTRFKRRHHENTFLDTLDEVESLKELIKSDRCICCEQQTMQLDGFTRSPEGWQAEVSCKNCRCSGYVNSEGFKFTRISDRGKAVAK